MLQVHFSRPLPEDQRRNRIQTHDVQGNRVLSYPGDGYQEVPRDNGVVNYNVTVVQMIQKDPVEQPTGVNTIELVLTTATAGLGCLQIVSVQGATYWEYTVGSFSHRP